MASTTLIAPMWFTSSTESADGRYVPRQGVLVRALDASDSITQLFAGYTDSLGHIIVVITPPTNFFLEVDGVLDTTELGEGIPVPTHELVSLSADIDTLVGISGQVLSFDAQTANTVLAGPASGAAADPTMRALVDADIPSGIGRKVYSIAASDASPLSKANALTVCDGTADDVDINAALALISAYGGTVYLSDGTFDITAALDMVADNLALKGQGRSTILALADNSNCDVIRSTASRIGIHLSDFTIEGNKANQTVGVGVRAYKWGDSSINRLRILNTKQTAIYATYPTSAVPNIHIAHNYIYMPDDDGIAVDGHFQDVTVEHNYIDNPLQDGIYFNTAGGTCKNVKVLHNDIFLYRSELVLVGGENVTPNSSGIVFNNSTGSLDVARIESNTILRTQVQRTAAPYQALFGIWIPVDNTANSLWLTKKFIINNYVGSRDGITQTSGDGISVNGANVTLALNQVHLVGMGDGYVIGGGSVVGGSNDWVVTGNRSIENQAQGFLIEALHRSTFTDNIANNNGQAGFSFRGSIYNTITGQHARANTWSGMDFRKSGAVESEHNNITGGSFNGNTRYGIEETDAANNNFYKDAAAEANVLGPILIIGANSIARNNFPYLTEGSGTGSIASGATSAVITHGLSVTPALKNINITLGENPSNDPGNIWVDTITSTQFTVHCRADPGGSNLDFAWNVVLAGG